MMAMWPPLPVPRGLREKGSRVLRQEPSSDANHVRRLASAVGVLRALTVTPVQCSPKVRRLASFGPQAGAYCLRAHRNRCASTERKAVLPTISILVVGCFVVCVAVLVLASVTDGGRKASVRAASARRAYRLGRP